MAKSFIEIVDLRSIDTATLLAGTLKAIGNPMSESLSLIRITNDSNTNVIISYDGISDHEFVRASGGVVEINFQECADATGSRCKLSKGTQLYARGTAGVGLLYVSGYLNK